MKTLFENENQTVYLHEDIPAFEQRFKSCSSDIFGDDYISEMKHFGKAILENQSGSGKVSNLIINTLAGGPTMEPKVQEWMHSYFYPLISNAGINTKAYCLGEEIIAKLSVELTAEEDPNALFKFKFFAELEEGMSWLKSK